ncbi:hypothetical protein F0310_04520 (plasmid) [Borrelia sp. A-FGy1]|uniref:hypothetical protein n=1 Tax=Borrelia sp. A-FGy1 TaxID=2608247 RepID=UPI0015F6DD88|nr:hypothetical protein [Borrelia sp. A-FGy1]QMU99682.1 hypothetical protein F0310_04520 [Borrelia sp. A-FGy1]
MRGRLERVPFLTLGTFNGTFEVTNETLENIIKNFKEEKRDIPIFIGHNDFLRSSRGAEAQISNGWIDDIVREGDILYFSGSIDDKLYSLIESGSLRGCSGEYHLKDKDRDANYFLGGMAILGSDIPAVDIAKVSKKNLAIQLKRKFLPEDSYLNEGVILLSKDGANILFEANLRKFLSLNNLKDVNAEEIVMKEEEEIRLKDKVDHIADRVYANLKDRIGKLIDEIVRKYGNISDKDDEQNGLKGYLSITEEQMSVMKNLSQQLRTWNENFMILSAKKTDVTTYITDENELIENIKLHQKQNNFTSFTEAEMDFRAKNANRIRI